MCHQNKEKKGKRCRVSTKVQGSCQSRWIVNKEKARFDELCSTLVGKHKLQLHRCLRIQMANVVNIEFDEVRGLQNRKWSVNSFPKGLQKDKSEKHRFFCCISSGNSTICKLKKTEDHYTSGLLLIRKGGSINDSKQWEILRNWKWVHKPLSKSVHQHENQQKKIEIAHPSSSTFSQLVRKKFCQKRFLFTPITHYKTQLWSL